MSKKYMSIILVIIWMSVIFIMSSFDGSVSSSQSNFIVDKLVNIFNIENTDIVSLIVRKLAHYMEYLILGVLMINMFSEFDIKINTKYIIAIIICIIYASSDEIHQIFIAGRCFAIRDILIDSMGSISGIYIYRTNFNETQS